MRRKKYLKIKLLKWNKKNRNVIYFYASQSLKKKKKKSIFENLGSEIGLLFQISDDLIDHTGSSKIAGKKLER